MLVTRITADALAAFPAEVVRALGLKPGDELAFEVGIQGVLMTRADVPDMFVGNFSTFTEWDTEADREAFRDL